MTATTRSMFTRRILLLVARAFLAASAGTASILAFRGTTNADPAPTQTAESSPRRPGPIPESGPAAGSVPRVVWHARVGEAHVNIVAPVLAGEYVLFPGERELHCLARSSGETSWMVEGAFQGGRPAVHGDLVLVAHPRGVQALDLLSGEERWVLDLARAASAEGPFPEFILGLTVAGDEGYAGTRTHQMACFDVRTGRLLWIAPPGRAPISRPIVAGDRVLAAAWGKSLVCSTCEGGEILWETELPGILLRPPLAEDGVAYALASPKSADSEQTGVGAVAAIEIATGKVLWRTEFREEGSATGGPALVGNVLVVATVRAVLGLRAVDGSVLWSRSLVRYAHHDLVADPNGRVFDGTEDGRVVVLRAADGALLEEWNLNALPETASAPKYLGNRRRLPVEDLGMTSGPAIDGARWVVQTEKGWGVMLESPGAPATEGK